MHVVNGYSSVSFPKLPGGLITRPTLVWDVAASKPGKQRARVTYQTGGMTWWADYNLVFEEGKDANSGVLDVGAWVSIINQSGASYPDAGLKLIAGDVQRIEPTAVSAPYPRAMAMAEKVGGIGGFAEGEKMNDSSSVHCCRLCRQLRRYLTVKRCHRMIRVAQHEYAATG